MRKTLCTSVTAIVVSLAGLVRAGDLETVAKGNTAFATDLYAQLAAEKGNLFFSPTSISSALAMTYGGARGATAQEMAKALHFDLEAAKLHPAFGELMKSLTTPKKVPDHSDPAQKKMDAPYELYIANALWGQKGFPFRADFLDIGRKSYGAELAELDYIRAAEEARATINKWVEEQTKQKIKDLIPKGALDDTTRLVLTNAIYFKSPWADPFQKHGTVDGEFKLAEGKTVKTKLMHHSPRIGYMANEDMQAVDISYRGEALSMTILLPRAIDGLPALEKRLTPKALDEWIAAMRRQEVRLTLPKFKVESQFSLGQTLSKMGMPTAFTPAADFSGMVETSDKLMISQVVHKAYVDVNEEGTEAAAATAVMMSLTSAMPQEPVAFTADHPFLFLIRHRATNSVLFMGRLSEPK